MARVPREAMEPAKPPAPLASEAAPVKMTVYIANSILTHAPLTEAQLECARVAYRDAAVMLQHLGPRFANARRDAIDMHNRVVRWIKGAREEEMRRKTVVEEETLLEINP